MEVREIKTAAETGQRPEGSMQIYDELLFYKLKDIYQLKRMKLISDAEFETNLRACIAEYRMNTTRVFFDKAIREQGVKRWKEAEGPVSDFLRNPTIEKAVHIVKMLYGMEVSA